MIDENAPALILNVVFFKTELGREPTREWLKNLTIKQKKRIGEDIKTVQFGWPIGMPVVRKMESGLWEVRSKIDNGIVRILFTVVDGTMVLLHGFIKKSQKTPKEEIEIARNRKKNS
jgi:phage-related protein